MDQLEDFASSFVPFPHVLDLIPFLSHCLVGQQMLNRAPCVSSYYSLLAPLCSLAAHYCLPVASNGSLVPHYRYCSIAPFWSMVALFCSVVAPYWSIVASHYSLVVPFCSIVASGCSQAPHYWALNVQLLPGGSLTKLSPTWCWLEPVVEQCFTLFQEFKLYSGFTLGLWPFSRPQNFQGRWLFF